MKVILEKQDTIELSEVTNKHILVAVVGIDAFIYTMGDYNNLKTSQMLCVSDDVTVGTKFSSDAYNGKTIQEVCKQLIEYREKFEVFNQCDWKKALEWLIENV